VKQIGIAFQSPGEDSLPSDVTSSGQDAASATSFSPLARIHSLLTVRRRRDARNVGTVSVPWRGFTPF